MRRVLFGVAVFLAGCADGPPDPVLREISPAQGPHDRATPVTITGEGFFPKVTADFTDGRRSRLSDDWSVRVGTAQLAEVKRIDESTLSGTVPAGLTPGFHTLVVTDPYDREVTQ